MDQTSNSEQNALWNGTAGQAWVEMQAVLDGMFAPLSERLVEAARERRPARVLDVGCGTGGTTLAIARQLAGGGACTGVDISEPLIAVARQRAARDGLAATFIRADAQTHAFERAAFDMIVSRFGVMFFDDPIAAFANLRRAASERAEVRLLVWRSAAENPFMTAAERAAAPFLPNLPARAPDAPGQFAFADAARVRRVLSASGWSGVDLHAVDAACVFPTAELDRYFTRLGPLGRALSELDDARRERIIMAVRAAFAPYVHGDTVRFTAACWVIEASADAAEARERRHV